MAKVTLESLDEAERREVERDATEAVRLSKGLLDWDIAVSITIKARQQDREKIDREDSWRKGWWHD